MLLLFTTLVFSCYSCFYTQKSSCSVQRTIWDLIGVNTCKAKCRAHCTITSYPQENNFLIYALLSRWFMLPWIQQSSYSHFPFCLALCLKNLPLTHPPKCHVIRLAASGKYSHTQLLPRKPNRTKCKMIPHTGK